MVALFAQPPQAHGAPQAATQLAGVSYGANHSAMQTAANNAKWPQQQNQWCGIATIAAIARYQGSTTATQSGVANYLNSSAAISVWGEPTHTTGYWGPGFKADISRDFGTDPRSITIGLDWAAVGSYHQLIAGADSREASIRLARDLERSKQPISVFVDHALHSVVVSAVFSTTDPLRDPSGITGFEVWDPGWNVPNAGIQPDEFDDVSLSTWTGSTNYWGSPYNVNLINGYTYDPDPAVGPYTFDPSVAGHAATLWSGHYVYVRPDPITILSTHASVDWAFNEDGQLIKGFSGQFAPGYRGSTAIWKGAHGALSSETAYSPAFSARGAYDPNAANSSPAAALLYVGADSSHELNIRTTQDGLTYSAATALPYSSNAAPAVLVLAPTQSGGKNIIVAAWDDTSTAHSIHVLYDVYDVTGATKTVTLSYSSGSAPGLAWFHGQVWLTWAGTDSAHEVNVLPLGANGLTPGTLTTLSSDPGATGGPALINDAQINELILSWAQSGGAVMTLRVSTDGAQWTEPASGSQLGAATGGGVMVAALAQIPGGPPNYPIASAYMVWRATGGDIMAQPFGPNLAEGAVQLAPDTAAFAPAASYIGGPDFILVWAGTDSGRHIYFAQMQM